MMRAPAEEKIDEPACKFLRPRSDIAHFELLTYPNRPGETAAGIARQRPNIDRAGDGRPTDPATVSGLSEQDCSHRTLHLNKRVALQNLTNDGDGNRCRIRWS